MADTDKKTTTVVTSPEKKALEKEIVEEKVVEEVEDEDSKASENGKAENGKENGTTEEKEEEDDDEEDDKEVESTENGDSTDAPSDACCIKRKSTAGVEASDETSVDGVSPEKKAKLEEKAAAEVESNGREDAETAA